MFNQKDYNKNYYQEHKEEIKGYSKRYYEEHRGYYKERNKEWQSKHKEHYEDYKKKYYRDHKEENKEHQKKYYKQRRLKLLNIISNNNPCCVRCGCNDIRLLEINHKNGGGNKETKKGKKSSKLRNDILNGKRKTDDLELLCRVCNSRHWLELKYGKLSYRIFYNK